jgi:HPt (histidine-containing phosphotransfer) domain-containing protein
VSTAFHGSCAQFAQLRARYTARLADTRRALAVTTDPSAAGEVTHRLKGSAPMYGFDAVGEAAAAVEARLRAGDNVSSALSPLLRAIDGALSPPSLREDPQR